MGYEWGVWDALCAVVWGHPLHGERGDTLCASGRAARADLSAYLITTYNYFDKIPEYVETGVVKCRYI